jgi:hypothetical protein
MFRGGDGERKGGNRESGNTFSLGMSLLSSFSFYSFKKGWRKCNYGVASPLFYF